MSLSKICFAMMMLLNNHEAVKVEQASQSEFNEYDEPEEGSSAPAQVYDLTPWKLQTPDFKYNDGRTKYLSKQFYKSTNQRRYQSDNWKLNPEGDGIRMSVPLWGARTSSKTANPRMELRELNQWPLTSGSHKLKASIKIEKTIPGVNFDLGQILRTNTSMVVHRENGDSKRCAWHAQILYETDLRQITVRARSREECRTSYFVLPSTYEVGQPFEYELAIVDGVGTFKTTQDGQVKDEVDIGNFDFLATEQGGIGEDGYFKTGIYLQQSCATQEKTAPCQYGPVDDVTSVDFYQIHVNHTEDDQDDEE